MARRKTVIKVCDRCPVGKEKRATRTMTFALEGATYRIDVCEPHGAALERDILAWARLAEEVEQARMFSADYTQAAKRAAELRSRQAHVFARPTAVQRESAPVLPLPSFTGSEAHKAGEYQFTEHAVERLQERQVAPKDALLAATRPTVRRPGRMPELVVHERAGVKVVVNPSTNAIITVARTADTDRKAN